MIQEMKEGCQKAPVLEEGTSAAVVVWVTEKLADAKEEEKIVSIQCLVKEKSMMMSMMTDSIAHAKT